LINLFWNERDTAMPDNLRDSGLLTTVVPDGTLSVGQRLERIENGNEKIWNKLQSLEIRIVVVATIVSGIMSILTLAGSTWLRH